METLKVEMQSKDIDLKDSPWYKTLIQATQIQ